MNEKYYNILLPVPTEGVYTYYSEGNLHAGERVIVPFGKRDMTGIVIGVTEKPDFECKEITMCYNESPLFSENYIKFLKNMSSYYTVPLGLVFHGVISEKILNVEIDNQENVKSHPVKNITLTDEQQKISDSININSYSCHLIKGITGSGKTEIYQDVAKKVINAGKQVLYIVPEISLTPQLIERLAYRLGVEPSIYHYKLTDKLRKKHFIDFATGSSKFMLGARSALFVPAKDLGLIIIDEEHDSSYKQTMPNPRYHARDVAKKLCELYGARLILGSATPSIESYYEAINTNSLFILKERYNNALLPKVVVIDMREERAEKNYTLFSKTLQKNVKETVEKGEQVIFLINRRGFASYTQCLECGTVLECPKCAIPLIYHNQTNSYKCHYCNYEIINPKCPKCDSEALEHFGLGSEKVELSAKKMFPDYRIERLDSDSLTKKNEHVEIITCPGKQSIGT